MLKIRLKRIGRRNLPVYQIIVTENLTRRDGKFLKQLGFYDPIKKKISLNMHLISKYIKLGAIPTETVKYLIYKVNNSIN
jgi:small subunit ribosomal protein S16